MKARKCLLAFHNTNTCVTSSVIIIMISVIIIMIDFIKKIDIIKK